MNSLSPYLTAISRWIWVRRYQNVSILDFIGAKDDGGGGNKVGGNCVYGLVNIIIFTMFQLLIIIPSYFESRNVSEQCRN